MSNESFKVSYQSIKELITFVVSIFVFYQLAKTILLFRRTTLKSIVWFWNEIRINSAIDVFFVFVILWAGAYISYLAISALINFVFRSIAKDRGWYGSLKEYKYTFWLTIDEYNKIKDLKQFQENINPQSTHISFSSSKFDKWVKSAIDKEILKITKKVKQ